MKKELTITLLVLLGIALGGLLYICFGARTSTGPAVSDVATTTLQYLTYKNPKYGFSFEYPANWKIVEGSGGTKVTVKSNVIVENAKGTKTEETIISFSAQENGAFKPTQTKLGNIEYDPVRRALVDTLVGSEEPPRCLSLGSFGNVPAFYYGGSNMSYPAYHDYVIFVGRDYMIVVHETMYGLSSELDFIRKSFVLGSGWKERVPECATGGMEIHQDLLGAGRRVLGALQDSDYLALEEVVSSAGLSWNEFPILDFENSDIAKDAISEIPKDTKTYLFGYTDGKGDPIVLTTHEYLKRWIYNHDYLNAPKVAMNKKLGGGNYVNTILTEGGDRPVLAYHFPGFDPKYSGFDWTTLYLVFDIEGGQYKLRGIAKDNWSI